MAENSGGYIGNKPSDSSVTIARQAYTSTGVTTDFTFRSGYTPGYLDAYLNGVRLIETDDYVATDGTTLSLSTAAQDGDTLELIAYKAFNVSEFTLETELGGNFNVSNDLTVGGNINLEGNLDLQDSDKILLGTGDDLQIYHDGGTSFIEDAGVGNLHLKTNGSEIRIEGSSASLARFYNDASVELHHSGSKKIETTSSGINITGTTDTDQLIVSGDSTFSGNLNIGIGATVGFGSTAYFKDNASAFFGDGEDLEIYHDGTNSYIIEGGTGALRVGSSRFQVKNPGDSKLSIDAFPAGEVALYYDNSKKFETTSSGAIVTGILTATDFSGASGGAADFPNGLTGTTGTFSGNVSAVDGTFTGNVSIAGTLTYEDVTNIDSIGIVTARDAVVISEDNAIHFRGTADDDFDAILRQQSDGGQLLINSRHIARINIDANSDSTDAYFAVGKDAATSGSTELFRVQEDGNVGIGTDNPQRKFVVSDDGTEGLEFYPGDGANGSTINVYNRATSSFTPFSLNAQDYRFSPSGGAEAVRIKSDGKVGIGTNNPTHTLQLFGTSSSTFRISKSGILAYDHTFDGSTYEIKNNNGNAGIPLIIGTKISGGESLRITSSGSVGIGTDNPSGKLHVSDGANGLEFNVNSQNAIVSYDRVNTVYRPNGLQGSTVSLRIGGVGTALHVDSTAKVGIGTDIPQSKLEVAGTISQTVIEYPTIRPTLDLNFAATKTLDRRITFTRDSIATYYGDDGLLKYASNNVPRFDHDPDTRESLGLLIEHSSTNLISGSGGYGSDIRIGTNLGNAPTTEVVDGITLPDGTVGQVRRLQIHSSGNSGMRWGSTGGGNINTPYSASVWGRAVSGTASFSIDTNDQGNIAYGLTEEWVRMKVTGTTSEGAYQFLDLVGSANANGYFWGFQLENEPFVSSYIPVASNESNKTRAQDNAKITGTNFSNFYNQTEGTFFVEADTINPVYNDGITGHDNNNNNYTIVGTGDSPNRFQLRFDDEEPFQVLGFGPNSTSAITTGVSLTPTLRAKIAGAFKQDDVRGVAQGEIILTDTSFDMISPTSLFIGSLNGSSEILPGHVMRVSYYNKALPNAQLQGLTQQ